MAAVPSDSSLSLPKSPVPKSVPARFLQSVLDRVTPAADSLRGKFLFSLVLVILVMTFCTLLAVRQLIEVRAERQTAQDAQNSLLTFQVVARQQHMALSRKAELLATLTFLRAGDTTAIREASQDPWQSEDCDLFALTDRAGKITALATRGEAPPSASNEAIGNLLRASNATLADDTRKPTLDCGSMATASIKSSSLPSARITAPAGPLPARSSLATTWMPRESGSSPTFSLLTSSSAKAIVSLPALSPHSKNNSFLLLTRPRQTQRNSSFTTNATSSAR